MYADVLTHLPKPSLKNIAVRVRKSAEKAIRNHPWLFDRAIESVSHTGSAGDVAILFDHKRRFLAAGLFDPDSPIRVKLLQHGKSAKLDCAFYYRKLDEAFGRRNSIDTALTTGYRLVNGENDALPAVIADRYASTVVLKLYSPIWFPHLRHLVDYFAEIDWCERVVLRLSRRVQGGETFGLTDGMTLFGDAPKEPVKFLENNLTFEADVERGQKTGHFLDQRDNRQRVRGMTAGKRVLDVFASTGGFTVYTAAGGASHVTAVDLSGPTLAVAKRNLAHNDLHNRLDTRWLEQDAFDALAQLAQAGKRFDVVIIDPPSFAQKQADVEGALRAYRRLTRLGLRVLQSGGTFVQASCSSRVSAELFFHAVEDEAKRLGRPLRNIHHTQHPLDHPITFHEGAYLKCLFARA